jgi:hypothetical protein
MHTNDIDRFDVEFPEEVDDEYWENEAHPELAFKQPKGKPSVVAAFNTRIKLSQIMAFALRTVVSISHIFSASLSFLLRHTGGERQV